MTTNLFFAYNPGFSKTKLDRERGCALHLYSWSPRIQKSQEKILQRCRRGKMFFRQRIVRARGDAKSNPERLLKLDSGQNGGDNRDVSDKTLLTQQTNIKSQERAQAAAKISETEARQRPLMN